MNNKEKEIVKETLLKAKRINEVNWRGINCCIFMEQVTDLSGNKEKALSKLKECADLAKTISRLCDRVMTELEKSTTDFSFVKAYTKKIEYASSQLKDLVDDYNSLRKKPVEKD